jgi:hypothetical protein
VASLLIKVILAPALMVAATLAARRGGARLGGLVASFPAIVGPVVLVTAVEHGTRTAADTAAATLLGLVGWSGFAVAYAQVARRRGWITSLGAGWLAAAAMGAAAGVLAGGAAAVIDGQVGFASLLVAGTVLSRQAEGSVAPVAQVARAAQRAGVGQPARTSTTLLVRAALTAVAVTALASAVSVFGATVGGILAALPILASLLTVFTHRQGGSGDAVEILRGMVVGMIAFAAFCEVAALTLVRYGTAVGLALATGAACLLQTVFVLRRRPTRWPADTNRRVEAAGGPALGRGAVAARGAQPGAESLA